MWKDAFVSLWERFFVIFMEDGNFPLASSNTKPNGTPQIKPSINFMINYTQLLSYIFFIINADNSYNRVQLLYWVWFVRTKDRPSKNGLVEMTGKLWGSNHPKTNIYRNLVKVATKHMELDDFVFKKFQVYDWRSDGAFSIPIYKLQKELLRSIGTFKIWKHVRSEIKYVSLNPSVAKERIADNVNKWNLSLGERKQACREVEKYLVAITQFYDITKDGQPFSLAEAVGKVRSCGGAIATRAKLLVYNFRSSPKVLPEVVMPERPVVVDDHQLAKEYGDLFSLPVDIYYVQAGQQVESAQMLVEAAVEDVALGRTLIDAEIQEPEDLQKEKIDANTDQPVRVESSDSDDS